MPSPAVTRRLPGAKFLYRDAQSPAIIITEGDLNETYRHIAADSETLSGEIGRPPAGHPADRTIDRTASHPPTGPQAIPPTANQPSADPAAGHLADQPGCLADRRTAAPGPSVGLLEVGERTPATAGAQVHGHGELALAPGGSVDGGADLGRRLVRAERVVARQVDKPAVVEFH